MLVRVTVKIYITVLFCNTMKSKSLHTYFFFCSLRLFFFAGKLRRYWYLTKKNKNTKKFFWIWISTERRSVHRHVPCESFERSWNKNNILYCKCTHINVNKNEHWKIWQCIIGKMTKLWQCVMLQEIVFIALFWEYIYTHLISIHKGYCKLTAGYSLGLHMGNSIKST